MCKMCKSAELESFASLYAHWKTVASVFQGIKGSSNVKAKRHSLVISWSMRCANACVVECIEVYFEGDHLINRLQSFQLLSAQMHNT